MKPLRFGSAALGWFLVVTAGWAGLAAQEPARPAEERVPKRAPPFGHDYYTLRGSLLNSRIKFEREKTGRVVFLGGSITHMKGWRDMVCQDLQRRFPGTRFDFIDAGIPSTGSTPGAFRFSRDVLAHGPVDLLFEEAAVNDQVNYQTGVEQVRGMEGIIRQARRVNPLTDIVMLYLVHPTMITSIQQGKMPEVIVNHEKIAERYGVTAINLAQELTDRIRAGECTWDADIRSEHPAPFGQHLYANAIGRLFDHEWAGPLAADAVPKPHPLPGPVDPASYFAGRLVDPAQAVHDAAWKLVERWRPADRAGNRPGFVDVPFLVTDQAGATLHLKFAGNAVGVFVTSGPDAGVVEYSIDGGPPAKRDLYTHWSPKLHLPWAQVLAAGLPEGAHDLRLTVAAQSNAGSTGHAVRIVNFLVNGPGPPPAKPGFALLEGLLRTPGFWEMDPNRLVAQFFPAQMTLQQGSSAYPLLFSAQRSDDWPGIPVWGEAAYETEYYCFDPARPIIKLHLGRALIGSLHQARVEAVAEARDLRATFPSLDAGVPAQIQARVDELIAALQSAGARRLPFTHPKISQYLLPGGTKLTLSDFSGSQQGSVYVEIDLEPAAPLADKLSARLPAFPGAEGYGRYSVGGRGGKVYLVTTLEDYLDADRGGRPGGRLGQASVPPPGYDPKQWVPWIDPMGVKHEKEMQPILPGYPRLNREPPIPGSLRAAVDAEGPRTILFRVSGTIALKAPLFIRNPYVTIVGSPAPGEGVQLRNWGVRVETHDVILRYLRVRVGDIKGPGDTPRVLGEQTHALDITGMNVMVDHCEFAYANDQVVNFYGSHDRRLGVTFQWSYEYGGLLASTHEKGEHSMGMIADGFGYVTVHHSLLAHSRNRNPRAWGVALDYRNNVLYDYQGAGYGNAQDSLKLNYVGNTQRRGRWLWGFQATGPFGQYYSEGNRMPPGAPPSALSVPAETLMPEPFAAEPVVTDKAEAAEAAILAGGGATLPARDSITRYVADTVRNNTGSIPRTTADFPSGGYASYPPAAAPVDSDGDGIPDEWEIAHGLDPHNPSDASRPTASGYTALEEYLNDPSSGRPLRSAL